MAVYDAIRNTIENAIADAHDVYGSGAERVFQGVSQDTDMSIALQLGGKGTASVTRSSVQNVLTDTGYYFGVAANTPAYRGRVVQNLLSYSEDFSNAAWAKVATATVTGTNTINLPAEWDGIRQTYSSNVGDKVVFSIELSGVGTVQLRIQDATTWAESNATITLTSTPTRYSLSRTVAAGSTATLAGIVRAAGNTATQVTANYAQLENSTNNVLDTTTPSEYVPTGASSAYETFSTTNGNTVASNVVTAGVGTELTTWGLQVDPAQTQHLLYSRDIPSGITAGDWTISATPTSAYTQVGLTGAVNTATILGDDGGSYEYIEQAVTVPNDSNTNTYRLFILKDSDTSRYPGFQLFLDDGTDQRYGGIFDTKNGAFTGTWEDIGTTNSEVNAVQDSAGTTIWWEVLISVANNSTGNVSARCFIYPAISSDGTSISDAATGSIILGNAEFYKNKTIAQIRGSGPVFEDDGSAEVTGAQTTAYSILNHNQSAGAYYVEWMPYMSIGDVSSTQVIITATNAAGGNILGLFGSDGKVTQYDLTSLIKHQTNYISGTQYKLASLYSAFNGKGAVYINGVEDNDADGYDGDFTIGTTMRVLGETTHSQVVRNLRHYAGGSYAELQAQIDKDMT